MQGLGNHGKGDVQRAGIEDLQAVSTILADKASWLTFEFGGYFLNYAKGTWNFYSQQAKPLHTLESVLNVAIRLAINSKKFHRLD